MSRMIKLFALLLAVPALAHAQTKTAKATFAGGCFWCMEEVMDAVPGVISTTSGYIGGKTANPTYEQVSDGNTGHAEAVEVVYDPSKVTYQKLLDTFWRNVDPTTKDRQFCDGGDQYRAAIFYHGDEQRGLAAASKQKVVASKKFKKVYVDVNPATQFYAAEEYHQDYYRKNPARYKYYKNSCGRTQTLERIWGKK